MHTPSAPAKDVLSADRLCLRFGAVEALKSVSLTVREREIHAVIGPNGAGKSSLLNCLSGFYKPQSGAVRFNGADISALVPHKRAGLGISRTFQGIQTYPSMTARENILTGYHLRMKTGLFSALLYWGRVRAEEEAFARRAEEIIDFLELEERRHEIVGDMSYGLRKRVDLGRALALDPKILIMDEPMAGMSAEEKGDLARFILDIRDGLGIPVVLVEHDMEVVMDISDRITVIDFGQVIACGTPAEIRTNDAVIAAYLGGAQQ
ncbi:ABC transporter ATP-binding protein [Polymorphum gilvum]|uniref:ABC branched amino acid transporter family, ATPase subunit n=1 Tax=Polymorphum gilvum (strain LMG 25793 / CGMCC 1.9160 / SL003B-26A1) TaxID=991905 RepID=F2IYR1_POLGS|nr:ABC transporter ATP-binding protein [Polymorphum gilvum]ADZ69508.1 ABC branched amino acid transporter family, ATPase subunit [Polymorphum gilvum SL003B-26A1]